jgi:arylsulfatase A-like enzyme
LNPYCWIPRGRNTGPSIAVWPQKIAPVSTTLVELLPLPPPAVTFDGVSFAPALRDEPLKRDVIFSHFPHSGRADIEGFRAGTWVRRGDWKLIRFFADREDGTDRLALYHLAADIGETKNLAAEKPELANELNGLITGFLKETAAVVPIRNPAFQPPSTPETKER